ncbi:uncharacterized protein BDR25DRAFT_354696 [Lindgomyces ingoldianus]|uniref:Uncharacterized protein n=1 Tax=Lindgomyces ingoldianus TaxID=673940 RepID=A0ACB6QWU0_9PLEO|nr:uncharacterized protein BDR25DRAFT_354696 [Lindgomyces ingoldianus]KAF2471464.1 hypothetical protein BDR25DRAFT_354696 [Lindgomyces ingoldianus]
MDAILAGKAFLDFCILLSSIADTPYLLHAFSPLHARENQPEKLGATLPSFWSTLTFCGHSTSLFQRLQRKGHLDSGPKISGARTSFKAHHPRFETFRNDFLQSLTCFTPHLVSSQQLGWRSVFQPIGLPEFTSREWTAGAEGCSYIENWIFVRYCSDIKDGDAISFHSFSSFLRSSCGHRQPSVPHCLNKQGWSLPVFPSNKSRDLTDKEWTELLDQCTAECVI